MKFDDKVYIKLYKRYYLFELLQLKNQIIYDF